MDFYVIKIVFLKFNDARKDVQEKEEIWVLKFWISEGKLQILQNENENFIYIFEKCKTNKGLKHYFIWLSETRKKKICSFFLQGADFGTNFIFKYFCFFSEYFSKSIQKSRKKYKMYSKLC